VSDDMFGFEDERDKRARLARLEEEGRRAAEADRRGHDEVMARVAKKSAEFHRRHLLAEYRLAGVAPPETDENGTPKTSLSMLLNLGWRVEEVGGGLRALVPPWLRRDFDG
jgi:hypothetical protein